MRLWKFENENSEISEISHFKIKSFANCHRIPFALKPKDKRSC